MPKQNRVTPFGEIIATPERGLFMGNRGVLHDDEGHIKRPWLSKRWIVCELVFRGRKREVMSPDRYTELFFLDEATAFAAGHRPCAECRRAKYNEYCVCFDAAKSSKGQPLAELIDDKLHAERLTRDRGKRTFPASLDELPDGVFVTVPDWGEQAYILWGKHLLAWSPGGYHERRPRPNNAKVRVLTPRSTVRVIQGGYHPAVHSSALPYSPL
jgi:hypothetical protein